MRRVRLRRLSGRPVVRPYKNRYPGYVAGRFMSEVRAYEKLRGPASREKSTHGREWVVWAFARAIPRSHVTSVMAALIVDAPNAQAANRRVDLLLQPRRRGHFEAAYLLKYPEYSAQLCLSYLTLAGLSLETRRLPRNLLAFGIETDVQLAVLSDALPRSLRKIMNGWLWGLHDWDPLGQLEVEHPDVYKALVALPKAGASGRE